MVMAKRRQKNIPTVDIVFPVYARNAPQIVTAVTTLSRYCEHHLAGRYHWRIVLGINGFHPEAIITEYNKLKIKYRGQLAFTYTQTVGKGAGLKFAWEQSTADILSYMDVDLATGLNSFLPLLEGTTTHDCCVGNRYHTSSVVSRGFSRRWASMGYHLIIQRLLLKSRQPDLHCGFKAFRGEVLRTVLPHIQDPGWFFDTELMFTLAQSGYSIKSIPIHWEQGTVSGLSLRRVIPAFILKSLELRMRVLPQEIRKM